MPTAIITTIDGAANSATNPVYTAGTTSTGIITVKIDQTTPGTTNAVAVDELPAAALIADSKAIPTTTIVAALPMLSNGSTGTLDMQRNNYPITLLASAARTASVDSSARVNYNQRGILMTLNVTANPGSTDGLTVSVINIDNLSLSKTLVAFPVTTAASNTIYAYIMYPGAVETIATNQVEVTALPIPRGWYARVGHGSTGSWTYSLTADYIL